MTERQSTSGRPKQFDEVFCESCGEPIKEQAARCPHCGVGRQPRQPESTTEKDPMVAAIASLFLPGVGDLYNGEIAVGSIIFVGYFVVMAAWTMFLFFIAILTLGVGVILWVFWPVIFLLNPLSAWFSYTRAERINAGELSP